MSHYIGGNLTHLYTIAPVDIAERIDATRPSRVVFERPRLQSFMWTTSTSKPAAAKMARNVGEIDAWCKLIVAVCGVDIPAHSVSRWARLQDGRRPVPAHHGLG